MCMNNFQQHLGIGGQPNQWYDPLLQAQRVGEGRWTHINHNSMYFCHECLLWKLGALGWWRWGMNSKWDDNCACHIRPIMQLEPHPHQHTPFTHYPQQSLWMGQGKFITESTQWIILRLASMMSIEDTAMYTDILPSSIRRILAHFKKMGNVIKLKHSKTQMALTLCNLDIQVSHTLHMIKFAVDTVIVNAVCNCQNTRYLSWWTVPGASGSLWGFSIAINNLEDIGKEWIFHEEGT